MTSSDTKVETQKNLQDETALETKIPNKKTLKAIKDAKLKRNMKKLKNCKNTHSLLKKPS